MCGEEVSDFFRIISELVKIGISALSGILIATVIFLLNHRSGWRNRLTKELRVQLKFDLKHFSDQSGTSKLVLRYEINNSNGGELSINRAYLELPDSIKGNIGPNSSLGEAALEKGKYYLFRESKIMTHFLGGQIEIDDEEILRQLKKQKISTLRLIIETSRFGKVKSKFCKIRI